MAVKAKLNYLRIAPRKVRLVADLVRGKNVAKARTILEFTKKRAAQPLKKLLDSAVANARNNFKIDKEKIDRFYISEIRVDEGPTLKRWMPRSRGRAAEIHKKTSHITLVIDEKNEEKRKNEGEGKKKKARGGRLFSADKRRKETVSKI